MTPSRDQPDDHRRFVELAAAYSLGALEVDDREAFEAHLDGCADCQAELAALAPIPGLLARIDRDDVGSRPDPASGARVEREARTELAAMRARTTRWRAAAAALAAAALVLAVMLVLPSGGDPAPIRDLADVVSSEAATTTVTTTQKGWGTEIHVDLGGLPQRVEYHLWVVDASGAWSTAASWGPTPTGRALLTGATSIATDELARLVITSADRDDVLVDARTR